MNEYSVPDPSCCAIETAELPSVPVDYHGCQTHEGTQLEVATRMSHNTSNNNLQPFDWLTSAASLESILLPIFCNDDDDDNNNISNTVLHVGCGSSILGELLIEDERFHVSTVVNVDCDVITLLRMQQRWMDRVQDSDVKNLPVMQFVTTDFTLPDSLRHYTDDSNNISKFDVVIDKSTLDCMLCTDTGAVGLLLETYRCLKECGGVYLVISFHPPEFIRPLLEELPGADWDVECTSIPRKVEHLKNNLVSTGVDSSSFFDVAAKINDETDTGTSQNVTSKHSWSSGTFQPDDRYVKNVTVLTCRRRLRKNGNETTSDPNTSDQLDWDQVYDHVHRINNQWYQQTNPMLTKERVQTIERAFAIVGSDQRELSLPQCYPILFTDGERENLSYDDFIDDWQSFLQKVDDLLPNDRMSFETAIAFLHVMQ